ncbi:hypothetical protein G7A66_05485 [Altererythrobacter sp. SALINAS58]|uniref:hypothetical protein n=1 Tax=Alteripontixanthobacter muriae TaxID=2705546 RepID=UPI00157595CC|nr:hypothetical protein [Alteripontixanthobacter muriae]NTZ42546.1 hypothetical protein [Alteripontixanthobacter muriae]
MAMQRLFPSALVACIRDGRPPQADELARLSERLWSESVSLCAPDHCGLADKFALVAFSGCDALPEPVNVSSGRPI